MIIYSCFFHQSISHSFNLCIYSTIYHLSIYIWIINLSLYLSYMLTNSISWNLDQVYRNYMLIHNYYFWPFPILLSIYLSIIHSIGVSIRSSIYLYMNYQSIILSIYLLSLLYKNRFCGLVFVLVFITIIFLTFFYPSIYLSIIHSICVSILSSIYLSIHPSIYKFIYLSI